MIAIYGDKNGTQDSIAWWLCEEPDVGPQIYNAPWRSGNIQAEFNDPMLGTLVEDCRTYEDHDETMRLMENISGDFLAPWRQHCEWHPTLIWSNYFGALYDPKQKIMATKLILCNESHEEDCFHYIISHAFKLLSRSKVEDDTEVWWRDHVYVDGKDIGDWKNVWYNKYHNEMLKAFDNGELKYMWQLNFAHWDLFHALQQGHDNIILESHDNYTRLFKEKLENDFDGISQTIKNNTGLVVEDPNWFTQADQILDYLELSWTDSLRKNLNDYIEVYKRKRMWYNEKFKMYLD